MVSVPKPDFAAVLGAGFYGSECIAFNEIEWFLLWS